MYRYAVMLLSVLSVALPAVPVHGQEQILRDVNGNGTVSLLAIGDSLTFGVGDGVPPGTFIENLPRDESPGGYPVRLQQLLGIVAQNAGVPGEELITAGVFRIPMLARSSKSDFVVLMEGANDAVKQADRGSYARALQRSVNVIRAENHEPLIMTPPPPCCSRVALAAFTTSYSTAVREIADVNDVSLVDVERTFIVSCPIIEQCSFYNIPEGLHPNTKGYDAIAQSISATLLGIDIYAPSGAASLEQALGLPPGTVVVKPDPALAQ